MWQISDQSLLAPPRHRRCQSCVSDVQTCGQRRVLIGRSNPLRSMQLLPDAFTLEPPPPMLPQLEHGLQPAEARSSSGEYVPLDFLEGDWKQLSNGPWERCESIPVLEGRAIIWVLQHLARSSLQHGRKHLILTDSMSCSLALSKGRSSNSSMNRICRQAGAILLATGMRVSCRWIPSEINPADRPSRG